MTMSTITKIAALAAVTTFAAAPAFAAGNKNHASVHSHQASSAYATAVQGGGASQPLYFAIQSKGYLENN
jgi:hypothetical protein